MMIRMTVKITAWMNVTECVCGDNIMMKMLTCYWSVILFITLDVTVLALSAYNTSYEISSREPLWSQKITFKKFSRSDLAFP